MDHQVKEFGSDDPREMPIHFFFGAVRVHYRTAVRSHPEKQNCSICPRYWYVDADFACARCGAEFTFSADEQRTWYEEYGFWVDSVPKNCLACRRDARLAAALRREYDERIAEVLQRGNLDSRTRLAAVIDQLYEIGESLPPRIHENRRRLAHQITGEERGR